MARTYTLHEPKYVSASGPAAVGYSSKYPLGSELDRKTKALEKSIRNSHKIIEKAQKRCSRSGKDKSLLHQACRLGHIVNANPITKDGHRYVNPMTNGDRLFLEEMGTYKSIEYFNNQFRDVNNNLVYIDGYK